MAFRIPTITREELEEALGDRAKFILTPDNAPKLRAWAETIGFEPVQINAMSAVQLANLYHERGPTDQARDIERFIADAILRTVDAMNDPARLRVMVGEILLDLAPRRLEIVTPKGVVTLDGPTHYATPMVIRSLGLGDHVMMVGPAGCGKTTIGAHASKALQLPFYITNVVNDTHELMGYNDGYGRYHDTAFRTAFQHGGVWVADEIDAWEAAPLLAANSALANGFATFPDTPEPVYRHADFRMVATANTFGNGADRLYVGRNELDAASLDRFATINVDYDLSLERIFANGADRWLEHVWNVRRLVTEKKIRHVVSSRAIIYGSRGLAGGFTWDECEGLYLYKGLSNADRSKILP